MKKIVFVLLILLINFVSAIEIESFICPDEVYVNREFVCSLEVKDVNGLYDGKFYIINNDGGINKVWGETDWQRADWYLKNLINQNGEYKIKLIIHKDYTGSATLQLKLRENGESNAIVFEESKIEVKGLMVEISEEENFGEKEINKETFEEEESEIDENTKNEVSSKIITDVTEIKNKYEVEEKINKINLNEFNIEGDGKLSSKRIINLNSNLSIKEPRLIYESKNKKIKRYGFYGFLFLLILGVGLFLMEKIKDGKSNYDY